MIRKRNTRDSSKSKFFGSQFDRIKETKDIELKGYTGKQKVKMKTLKQKIRRKEKTVNNLNEMMNFTFN